MSKNILTKTISPNSYCRTDPSDPFFLNVCLRYFIGTYIKTKSIYDEYIFRLGSFLNSNPSGAPNRLSFFRAHIFLFLIRSVIRTPKRNRIVLLKPFLKNSTVYFKGFCLFRNTKTFKTRFKIRIPVKNMCSRYVYSLYNEATYSK